MGAALKADVAIVGGGPAGTTVATFLKQYRPSLKVTILEKAIFPREHVGESLLPSACRVLAELGVWDKVEAAGFPVKIGATYRWGASPKLWDFEFLPALQYKSEARPGVYRGQRAQTAFQVERSRFDEILLNHARSVGVEVLQNRPVRAARGVGNEIARLDLPNGELMEASLYVDASGAAGVIRRAMGVEVDEPSSLKNVAFWNYWENTDWAVSIGTDATRVLVLSIDWGWIWFIPIGPTRTSIGVVCPAAHYKKLGLSPEELYQKALAEEPKIVELTKDAQAVGTVQRTKDWSFIARNLYGSNWFLAGESAGFADPILAAGVSLTLGGSRELAFTILSILDRSVDAEWARKCYEETQKARVGQHIRFADFWYSANGQFRDLQEFTQEIAKDAGLELNADEAFRWLGTGGFISDISLLPTLADVSLEGVKQLTQRFTNTKSSWKLEGMSVVKLNLEGAVEGVKATYQKGKVGKVRTWERGQKTLPLYGFYEMVFEVLKREQILEKQVAMVKRNISGAKDPTPVFFDVLETWLADGWVVGVADPGFPPFHAEVAHRSGVIHDNVDISVSG